MKRVSLGLSHIQVVDTGKTTVLVPHPHAFVTKCFRARAACRAPLARKTPNKPRPARIALRGSLRLPRAQQPAKIAKPITKAFLPSQSVGIAMPASLVSRVGCAGRPLRPRTGASCRRRCSNASGRATTYGIKTQTIPTAIYLRETIRGSRARARAAPRARRPCPTSSSGTCRGSRR